MEDDRQLPLLPVTHAAAAAAATTAAATAEGRVGCVAEKGNDGGDESEAGEEGGEEGVQLEGRRARGDRVGHAEETKGGAADRRAEENAFERAVCAI